MLVLPFYFWGLDSGFWVSDSFFGFLIVVFVVQAGFVNCDHGDFSSLQTVHVESKRETHLIEMQTKISYLMSHLGKKLINQTLTDGKETNS